MSIWSSVLPAVIVSVFMAYLLSIRGHGRSTFRADVGTVELSAPQRQVTTMRITAACVPVILAFTLIVAPGKRDLAVVVLVVAVFLGLAGGLLWIAALTARRFIFSAEGILVAGFHGWQSRWSELAAIEAISPGADIAVFRFRGGRKVAINSFFDGWSDLMKQLPKLVDQDEGAREKVAAAIRELNRWKVGTERY